VTGGKRKESEKRKSEKKKKVRRGKEREERSPTIALDFSII
jgi:hypothetical protein